DPGEFARNRSQARGGIRRPGARGPLDCVARGAIRGAVPRAHRRTSLVTFPEAHVLSAATHGLRLLPIALLCPAMGGPAVPSIIRVTLAGGFGAAVYSAAGAVPIPVLDIGDFGRIAASELALGLGMALVAAMPIELARAAGRFIDTARGTTLGELHVP